MRSLRLTTPMMKGEDVREAQHLLAKNPFGTFFNDDFDGEYGEITHQATERAKFWLGYPADRYEPVAERRLRRQDPRLPLRHGAAAARYDQRRKKRITESKQQGKLREKALKLAVKQIGIREDPSRLEQRALLALVHEPAIRLEAAQRRAALVRDVRQLVLHPGRQPIVRKQQQRWAFCPFVVGDAEQGRHNLTLTRDPQPGDIAVYKFGSNTFKHIGLFREVDRPQPRPVRGDRGQHLAGQRRQRRRGPATQPRYRGRRNFVHVGK